jgi:hypothetical protein
VWFFSRFAGGVVYHWGFIGVGSSLGLIVGFIGDCCSKRI